MSTQQRRPLKIRFIRSRVIAAVTIAVALVAGYAAYSLNAPLPDLHATAVAGAETTFTGDVDLASSVVSSRDLPTAIGWLEGEDIWSNTEEPQQLASITKLIALLVCQEARPLAPGEDGPTYTVSWVDQEITADILAEDGIVHPYPLGFELSARDMFRLALIPSSNNITISYVNWIFGDNEAFLAATEQWASEHDLETLAITEPSGLSELNVASVSDLIRIARIALADPMIAETVRMPEAEVPLYGTVPSTNPLIAESGVLGMKTGTTLFSGFNLLAAREFTHGDRTLSVLSATLGRESAEDRENDSRNVLAESADKVSEVQTLHAGEVVAHVVTWDGSLVPLVARQSSVAVLAPGESADRSLNLQPLQAANPRAVAGSIAIDSPEHAAVIDVVVAEKLAEPGAWWRLTHPLR